MCAVVQVEVAGGKVLHSDQPVADADPAVVIGGAALHHLQGRQVGGLADWGWFAGSLHFSVFASSR